MGISLQPIVAGLLGNPGPNAATPDVLTPQQAAQLLAPYLPSGGGGGGGGQTSAASPWINAADPGHGLTGVVSGQDATAALQGQIDYLFSQPKASGMIQLPPGDFPLSGTLIIKGGVTLLGAGARATVLKTTGDFTAIRLHYTVSYGGFRDMWVRAYENAAATQNAVVVEDGVCGIIRDAWIWGGNWALETSGVDTLFENVYINGFGSAGGGVKSRGANWYLRCKIDCGPQPTNVGFYQGAPYSGGSLMENHLSQCDLSGPFQLSVYIEDTGTNTAVTIITDSVTSAGISIPHHNRTIFHGNEFGSDFLYVGNGSTILCANAAFPAITVRGPGQRVCGTNINIAG